MPCQSSRPTLKGVLAALWLVVPLLVLCDLYLDQPLAAFARDYIYRNPAYYRHTADIPDLLLQLVLLVTLSTASLYLMRVRKGLFNRFTWFLREVAWVTPSAYLAKSVLKPLFGRANNRMWLTHPEEYGFHWFRGEGGFDSFPSGHMIVVVALFAALARYYPRTRGFCIAVALLLGLALMGTSYHFLGDVVAGSYTGILLEAFLFRVLSREAASGRPQPQRCR